MLLPARVKVAPPLLLPRSRAASIVPADWVTAPLGTDKSSVPTILRFPAMSSPPTASVRVSAEALIGPSAPMLFAALERVIGLPIATAVSIAASIGPVCVTAPTAAPVSPSTSVPEAARTVPRLTAPASTIAIAGPVALERKVPANVTVPPLASKRMA